MTLPRCKYCGEAFTDARPELQVTDYTNGPVKYWSAHEDCMTTNNGFAAFEKRTIRFAAALEGDA